MSTEHIHNRISNQTLQYTIMDRRQLQTRYYNNVMRGGSRFLLHRIKKDHMIKLLLENEFGKAAVDEYNEQVKEWKACEWFCKA